MTTSSNEPIKMKREVALYFRDRFRSAREAAQKDAEDFDEIIFALEQLGVYRCQEYGKGLGYYQPAIVTLACDYSPLANPSLAQRPFCMPFGTLFDLVREGRNGAMHEGAYARHLTQHAIELAIVLEDAFNQIIIYKRDMSEPIISDFMVHNPVCAKMWQPLSFARQNMLANSFSYLPVKDGKTWRLVSDLAIATYLSDQWDKLRDQKDRLKDRKDKLAQTLQEASDKPEDGIKLLTAETVNETEDVERALEKLKGDPRPPVLLIIRKDDKDEEDLRGIVTAFDLGSCLD
jgi:CBS domain-containing protein